MPTPEFILDLRRDIGHRLLLLPGVAALCLDQEGRLLMIRRADDGAWNLPAGICEPGEEPSQTIAREIYEETGLHGVPERIAAVVNGPRVSYPNGDQCDFVTTYYVCRITGGTMGPVDGETTDVRWVPLDAPEAQARLARLPTSLDELLAGERAWFPWDPAWATG
jgi:8-oxo-dGTP pyrophosphatase MutT (NUDIX family)